MLASQQQTNWEQAELKNEQSESWERRTARTVVPNVKNLPKFRLKNSWNWRIILVPATIWQVLNLTCTEWPETEASSICRNLHEKFVKSLHDVNLFLEGFSHLKPTCIMVRKRIPSTSSNEPRTQEKDPRGNKKSKKTSNVPSFYLKLILVMFVVTVLGYYTYQGRLLVFFSALAKGQ